MAFWEYICRNASTWCIVSVFWFFRNACLANGTNTGHTCYRHAFTYIHTWYTHGTPVWKLEDDYLHSQCTPGTMPSFLILTLLLIKIVYSSIPPPFKCSILVGNICILFRYMYHCCISISECSIYG